jgi:hypothetical protein
MDKPAPATVQEPVQEPWHSASTSVAEYPASYPTGQNGSFDEEAPRSAFSVVEPPAELSTLTTHLTGNNRLPSPTRVPSRERGWGWEDD